MKNMLITITIIIGLLALTLGLGYYGVFYKNTVGVQDANADRNIFKENKSYVEGMINDLSRLKLEYAQQQDPIAKKALGDTIRERFSNFDINKIEDVNLRNFLMQIRGGY
jgi:hypothetical protein